MLLKHFLILINVFLPSPGRRSTGGQQRFGSLFTPSLANGLYSPFQDPSHNLLGYSNLYSGSSNTFAGSSGFGYGSNSFGSSSIPNLFGSTIPNSQQCPAILQGNLTNRKCTNVEIVCSEKLYAAGIYSQY